LVHPESIIHSLVAYLDGSVLAQLGSPDMRTPIAFALGWPDRIAAPSPRLNLPELAKLTFFEPDSARFPSIDLARQALRNGGAAATVLNASNEVAVQAFLEGKTGFLDIFRIVSETMDKMGVRKISCLEDVYETDTEARRVAGELSLACAANL